MKLLAALVTMAILGCATDTTVTSRNTDPESLKDSPAGISTFAFLDITTALPGLMGLYLPTCISRTVISPTQATLALAGCKSGTGGSLAGTLTVTDTVTAGFQTFIIDFGSLVNTRSTSVKWAYKGNLDLTITYQSATITNEPGFTLTITDTAKPASSKDWIFTCNLSKIQASSSIKVKGAFSFASGTTDSVNVDIDAAHPLIYTSDSPYPVSGTMTIKDTRAGIQNPETITALFNFGQVTINGVTITLGS